MAKKSKNYQIFSHRDCEFFPCHETDDPDNFNCLFCYCPLYMLGKDCGGNFRYQNGIKDCSHCMVPHKRDNYDDIIGKFSEITAAMKKGGSQ